jgi:hypothetical protein
VALPIVPRRYIENQLFGAVSAIFHDNIFIFDMGVCFLFKGALIDDIPVAAEIHN